MDQVYKRRNYLFVVGGSGMMPKKDVDCADRCDGVGMSEGVFFFQAPQAIYNKVRYGRIWSST